MSQVQPSKALSNYLICRAQPGIQFDATIRGSSTGFLGSLILCMEAVCRYQGKRLY